MAGEFGFQAGVGGGESTVGGENVSDDRRGGIRSGHQPVLRAVSKLRISRRPWRMY